MQCSRVDDPGAWRGRNSRPPDPGNSSRDSSVSRRQPWLTSAVVLTSLLAALALSELVLRVAGFSYPSFYVADGRMGTRLRAGVEGWYYDEGEAYIRINSLGLRDREHGLAKPADAVRIAVLGDSYAEAIQLPIERTFWNLLERQLEQCELFRGKRVEVINFGVSGYSTAQELLVLRHHAWRYSPDIVLLAFQSGNDVRDNSKAISGAYPRPYFVVQGEELVLDRSFLESPIYRLKSSTLWQALGNLSQYLRILQLLNKAMNRLGQPLSAPRSEQTAAEIGGEEVGLDSEVYFDPPRTQEWREAWHLTERLIARMNKEVAERGARFLLVTLSTGIQVHPSREVRESFARRLGVPDLHYPERRMLAMARRENIETVILAEALQRHAERHRVFLHGFPNLEMGGGHWNEEGHKLAAQLISKQMCSAQTSRRMK
jgi:hypothetical protein